MTPAKFEADACRYLLEIAGVEYGTQLIECALRLEDTDQRVQFLADTIVDVESIRNRKKPRQLTDNLKYKWKPVPVREFLYSPLYLNKEQEIFPKVVQELEEMNSGKYDEIVLTGGIGSGKTSCALYSQAYQIYLLSCLKDPHREFGLDRSSEIKLVFQSLNAKLAKGVDYNRFRAMLASSDYFSTYFPFQKDLESILKFPDRIEVEPIAGVETGAIGQNVIGGIIDEVNFMANTEGSKMSPEGGVYDQAMSLYNSIARRRKSRFMVAGGALPGLLCLVSSRNVPGQFTDLKEEEAKTNKRIYVYDKRVWEVKPDSTYSGEWFHIFLGDEMRKPRIIRQGEEIKDDERGLIDRIPKEYQHDFEFDITKAIRDIAGKSTLAIHPYLPNRELVAKCFGKRPNLFVQDQVDFVTSKPQVRTKPIRINPDYARWAHIDLGLTSDSAGIVIGHVPTFKMIDREGCMEELPVIEIDAVLEVRPPMNGEIDFSQIRRVLYRLRDMGLPLLWVSLDSFQSADTMQILRQQGFTVGLQSVDTTMVPYDITKLALYDGRIRAPKHDKLLKELLTLERNFKKNKIDHPSKGSKDLADALAGVVGGLCMRREIWAAHGVSPSQAISMLGFLEDMQGDRK